MQNTHVHVLPISCWVPSLSFNRFVDLQGGEIYLQLYCLRMLERLSLLKRVVQHLIAIEVDAESTDNQVPGHSSIPLQGSQPVVNSNPPKEQPRWNAAVRGEILRKFWLWDYLRWGVSKVGSVRIVWLTFLTCSWAFCYSFYGVMKIYHVTSFTCTCLACLRVRIWWIVCENWRVKWCRFVADMYRFQGLKRWNYNKRVAVSYKDDLSDWTVANYKFRNSRPVTEKLEES